MSVATLIVEIGTLHASLLGLVSDSAFECTAHAATNPGKTHGACAPGASVSVDRSKTCRSSGDRAPERPEKGTARAMQPRSIRLDAGGSHLMSHVSLHLLIVEDDEPAAELVRMFLQSQGHRV